jgi:rod shape-determining protein MreB
MRLTPKICSRARVVVGIPSNITNVEHRAAYDASISAGARQVFIVEEPMAAAIGARLPIFEATGSMVIDIGGGTTDIAVVSLGGMLRSKKITIAGDQFNSDIIDYVRDTYKLLIGEKTAEDIKIALASALPLEIPVTKVVRGRDVITGLPREIILRDADIRLALAASIAVLVEGVKEVLEHTPPEVVSDIMNRGIVMTGGGALIRGLPELIGEQTGIMVSVPEDPLTAVVRGTGMILQNMDLYQDVFVKDEYEVKSNFS